MGLPIAKIVYVVYNAWEGFKVWENVESQQQR